MDDTDDLTAGEARIAPPARMTIDSRRDGSTHVVVVEGELDVEVADELEAELLRIEATDAGVVVLDLAAVSFADSSALRVVLAAADRSAEHPVADRLRVVRGDGPVRRLFALTGTEDVVPFAD